MSKSRKAELKKNYLQEELEKLVNGEDKIVANWARQRLHKPLVPITLLTIAQTPPDTLEELIRQKVEDFVSFKLRVDWGKYKTEKDVLIELSSGA